MRPPVRISKMTASGSGALPPGDHWPGLKHPPCDIGLAWSRWGSMMAR